MKNKKALFISLVILILSISIGILAYFKFFNKDNSEVPLADNLKGTSLPIGFPKYTVVGESPIDGTIYVSPHNKSYNVGWLLQLNKKGELQFFKKTLNRAYLYRHFYTKSNKERYAYLLASGTAKYCDGGIDDSYLVICDENHNVLKTNITMLENGNVPENQPIDIHDYIVYDDNHYILIAAVPMYVDNIPGHQNVFVFNNVIQEIKDDKVIYQWESIDHPELYEYSFMDNDYENSNDKIAKDYAHINKIDRFSNGDYLVSFRHIGLVRLDYQTGNTKWVIGYKHNDFKMDENALPYTQHDSIILDDNTITLFDNAVGDKSRVLKYHIDEKNMSVEADIYVSEYPNSEYMGSSQLLKDDTYLINYGGNMQIVCFEIYDFKNKKQLFLFNFNNKDDIYAVTQGDYIFNRLYNPE